MHPNSNPKFRGHIHEPQRGSTKKRSYKTRSATTTPSSTKVQPIKEIY